MNADWTHVLSWLLRGAAVIALLNLVAIVSLVLAYAWHHGLKPTLQHRRARRHAFDRLLAHSSLDNHPTISDPVTAGEWWEW